MFGKNLSAARQAKGMTQRQVGEAIGAADDQVSKWERGLVYPVSSRQEQLAALLTDGDVAVFYASRDDDRAAA